MELRWRATEQTPRFVFLLAAMFLEILLSPILMASPLGLAGARAVTGVVLVAALIAIGVRRTPLVIFSFVVVMHALSVLYSDTSLLVMASAVRLVFLSYVCGLVIVRVLRERHVTYDTLAGAACAYMLIGLVWGDLFVLNELLQPGAFKIPAGMVVGETGDPRSALLYFSFVTLTTVGYGDVHPNNPGAGGLAVLEAVVGQLYIAVTVARLVGLHLSGQKE